MLKKQKKCTFSNKKKGWRYQSEKKNEGHTTNGGCCVTSSESYPEWCMHPRGNNKK